MREVVVNSTKAKFAQDIEIGEHLLHADEEVADGGSDTGPGPHELLLAALGSCTSMTLKLYSDRKGWPLDSVSVKLTGARTDDRSVITRAITMAGNLDAEQRKRLLDIADKCPVHKTLSGTIEIQTSQG